MDNGKKNTPKVLTTNDIRKRARDWTLAGDVGLLANLEQFSESIISKTQETQNNFNELVDHYEELYTKVGNITNQFLALQNCQFVENRVYDEETPTEEKPEVKEKDEVEREKLLLTQYKEAVEVGVKLLDTHFQEVPLPPNSDSEDEDEYSVGNSIIWKPKNPYASKKFPLLIGSAEWWADDHVGLGTSEDGLETEKMISESESEMESLKSIEKGIKSSSSSSFENVKSVPKKPTSDSSFENLFGFDKNENQQNESENLSKGDSSLLEEPANFQPDFEKETDKKAETRPQEQPEEKPNESNDDKPKKVDNAFTRELMAKLVSVTNKNEKLEKKPREKATAVKPDGSLLDETDDSGDLFSAKANKIPEKVGEAKGLFDGDDYDDEVVKRSEKDLFSDDDLFKATESQPFVEKIFEPPSVPESSDKKEAVAAKKNLVNDLFDDLDDDDTLFAARPLTHKAADESLSSMETGKKNVGESKDEEGLFDRMNTEVDDDLFNSAEFFDVETNKAMDSEVTKNLKSEDAALFSNEPLVERKPTIEDSVGKSVFDSVSKTVKNPSEDLFGFSSSKEQPVKKITMLDSDEEDDLFSKSLKEEKKPSVKVLTLPDVDDDDTALFSEKPKPPDSVSISSSRSSLFDDVSASRSRLASVFEKDKTNKPEDDLFNEAEVSLFGEDDKSERDLFSAKSQEKGKSSSLFADCDDEEDLFGVVGKEEREKSVEGSNKIQEDVFEGEEKQSVRDGGFMDDLGDDDLFGTTEPLTNLRQSKSEVISRSELFVEDFDDAELFSEKPASPKPKPPSSLSLKSKESEPKAKSVSKLNIPDNLKIKFESAAKHILPAGGGAKPSAKEKEVLDEPLQSSDLLKCPSKDRVKIPGRRRPQSRRARQEAIRNSGIWDEPTPASTSSNVTQPRDSMPSPAASNPLSPSTDEEDFFKVPELDTNFEKEDQSIFKSDLFESAKSPKLEDNLLFDGAPILSPVSSKKGERADEGTTKTQEDSLFGSGKTERIFDDDDDNLEEEDDESLFKTSKPFTGVTDLFQAAEKSLGKGKKSLFDTDLDDEDDLFGGKMSVTPKPANIGKPEDGGEGNEKENSSFVDPLGLMTNN